MKGKLLIVALIIVMPIVAFAQPMPVYTDSERMSEYREKIGLDLTIPDFDTKKIDAKVMGDRLAGILIFLVENYQQTVYDRRLRAIASEQNAALENSSFEIKKMKFIKAIKKGDDIIVLVRFDLNKNAAKIKQTDVSFLFTNGISHSNTINELFSYISKYVQAREQIGS